MNTLFVIPARAGSKGLAGKNSIDVCGKPLIQYTIEQALEADCGEVLVTSDCPKCLDIAREMKVTALKRPAELAQDDTPIIPVLHGVLNQCIILPDAICLLQPTSPVRPPGLIGNCLDELLGHTSAFTVAPIPHKYHPSAALWHNGAWSRYDWHTQGGFEHTNRQQLGKRYYRTGQVYVFWSNLLFPSPPTIYGNNMWGVLRTDPDELINIDGPEDLDAFRRYLELKRNVSLN